MAMQNPTTQNLIFKSESKEFNQPEIFFNFSLKVAYDILLKSRQSEILFSEMDVVLIIMYVMLIIFGVASNVLVCFVVMKQCARKKMDLQKSRNLYIVNLAVADLALCCICMPFTLIGLIQREWTFGSLLCKFVPVVQGTNITVSAGTITAIALDRYNTIVKSSSSNSLRSHKYSSVVVTVLLIWLLSCAITSPLFFYTVTESVTFENVFLYEKCIEKWPSRLFHSIFTVTLALFQFVIPVLVLFVIHLKISSYLRFHIRALGKQKPEIQIHSPTKKMAEEKNSEENEEDCLDKSNETGSNKELLYIKRKDSIGSENSSKSCESSQKLSVSSRKSSDCSRKNSDSSRNSCYIKPRKKSDFFLAFRENSDFGGVGGFSFSRFSYKSKSTKGNKRREIQRNRRTTFMLSCIALVYAFSWLPMTIFQIASTVIPQLNHKSKSAYLLFSFCHIVAMSSAITNPLLYGWLNTNFRREFSTIFSRVSSFYAKLFRRKFPTNTSKPPSKSNHSEKTRREEVFVQVQHNESMIADPVSGERNLSLNFSNGKVHSGLLGLGSSVLNNKVVSV